MQNSTEIFTIALGLTDPWELQKVEIDKDTQELNIYISSIRGHKFLMADQKSYTAHDKVDRKWQHLNFFQHKCYIHCKVPKVKQQGGTIITQSVPWARKGSGFTLLFEANKNVSPQQKNILYFIAALNFATLLIVRSPLGFLSILLPIFILKDYWKQGISKTLIKIGLLDNTKPLFCFRKAITIKTYQCQIIRQILSWRLSIILNN